MWQTKRRAFLSCVFLLLFPSLSAAQSGPTVSYTSPTSGPVGTSVTITGTSFGATQGTSTVTFNGTQATPTSWSDTQIVASVPNGATTGTVRVTVNGIVSNGGNGPTFTVGTPPVVNWTSPTSGPVGTSVTITGQYFGTTQGTSTVTFNGKQATPTSWSDTSIVAPVPASATTGKVQVTVNGIVSNGGYGPTFTIPVPPSIGSLSPSSAASGRSITITGTNFGTSQGSSTVKFNGTSATSTSWSDTSIVIPVPNGATTGNVVVTAAGTASNGVNFTVVTAPTITASAAPAPNAAGWNNSNVTVTFSCTAGGLPIATCSGPQTVSTEGAGQIVTGTVTDTSGDSATASVTLKIDKTPPAFSGIAPAEGAVLSTSTPTVTGTVSDGTSGVSAVTCNGAAAALTGSSFSCNISLNVGVNLVMVRATDLAGNVAGSNFHVSLSGSLPAPQSLQVSPATLNMVVGETHQFTAVDDVGRPRSDATWTVSNTTLATITTDSSPTLAAVAAGTVTLTCNVGGVTAQAQINILNGASLVPGTVRWSAPPLPGFTAVGIIQAVPTQNAPDFYSMEQDQGNYIFSQNHVIRAFTANGSPKWQVPISGTIKKVVPDGNGGLLVEAGGHVVDYDAQTGSPVWNLDGVFGNFGGTLLPSAIRQDGAVVVLNPFSGISGSVVALDGNSGRPIFSVMVPSQPSTFTSTCADTGSVTTRPESSPTGPMTIDSDGNIYILFSFGSQTRTELCNFVVVTSVGGSYTLEVLKIAPDGTSSTQMLNQVGAYVAPGEVVPDGQGGFLATWTQETLSETTPFMVTHVSSNGTATYQLPLNGLFSFGDFAPSFDPFAFFHQIVIGENGVAFATDRLSSNSDGSLAPGNIASFDINSGQVKWTYQAPSQNVLSLVASSAGGGLVAKATNYQDISADLTGTDTVLRFDSTGTPTSVAWSGASVQYLVGSAWLSSFNGSLNSVLGGDFDLTNSTWNFPDQKLTHAATRKIHLRVYKVNEAAVDDDFIRARIKTATDYWQKKGVQFDWNGVPVGVPACDTAAWPSCVPAPDNPHSILDVFTDHNNSLDPNYNQLDEVYRRYATQPKGITVLFVSQLFCNQNLSVAASTLSSNASYPGQGAFLNVVLAEKVDCSGFFTNTPPDVLDHEFGHVFQLPHVGIQNLPSIPLIPDIVTGVVQFAVPATNLMCGPVDQNDQNSLWLACNISRQFRWLLDFQRSQALKSAGSLVE